MEPNQWSGTVPEDKQEGVLDERERVRISDVRHRATGEQTNWTTTAYFLLTVIVLAISGLMLYPFLPAITGAIVLAVVTHRPYRWLVGKMRNATAAASSALVLVTISIIAPVLVLGQFFVRQAIVSVQMLQDAGGKRSFDSLLERFPPLARAIEHSSEFITLGDVVQRAAQFLGSHLIAVLSNSVAAISQLIIMLFLLFFLYRDEETMTRVFTRLLPLTGSETRVLMKRLGDTLNATVVGRIVVATIQGIVAGALFAFLGVRAAAVLALLTTVLGLIPPFGPYVVWIPVALWLGLTGHWIKMVVLLGAGTLIISSLDNFLYPALVGAHLRQHTAFVFLSILGGIWLFGISGVVIGPLMFSASEALLAIWRSRLGGDSGALES